MSQEGAIFLWLLVVSTVTSLVLLSSWVKQGEIGLGLTGEKVSGEAYDPPVTELKLLDAEVISRTIVTGADDANRMGDQSIDTARPSPDMLPEQAVTSLSPDDKNWRAAPASDIQAASISEQEDETVAEAETDSLWNSLSQNDWDQVSEMVVDAASDASLHNDTLDDAGFDASGMTDLDGGERSDESVGTEYAGIDLHELEVGSDSASSFNAIRSLIEEASAIVDGDFEQNRKASDQDEWGDVLERQSAKIRFASGSKTISDQMGPVLRDISDVLSRDDDTQIKVSVTTNEGKDRRQNLRLSQERGRALIARLVAQGIDFSRFSLEAFDGGNSKVFFHTVKVEVSPAPSSSDQ